MSNIVPKKFTGMPTLTPDKVTVMKHWYYDAVANANTYTQPSDVASYWGGVSDALLSSLNLVYSTTKKAAPEVVKEFKDVSKSGKGHFKLKLGLFVVAVIFIDGRLPKKIKAIWNDEVTEERLHNVADKVADKTSDITGRIQDSRDVIVGTAKDVKDKASDKVDDIKDKASGKIDDIKDQIEGDK